MVEITTETENRIEKIPGNDMNDKIRYLLT